MSSGKRKPHGFRLGFHRLDARKPLRLTGNSQLDHCVSHPRNGSRRIKSSVRRIENELVFTVNILWNRVVRPAKPLMMAIATQRENIPSGKQQAKRQNDCLTATMTPIDSVSSSLVTRKSFLLRQSRIECVSLITALDVIRGT